MEMNSLYIAGKNTQATSGETFSSINPANGEVIATLGQASQQDLELAIESAKQGFAIWSAMAPIERSRILLKTVEILRARNDELAALEVADTGKPLVHITAEKELLIENDFILLKSHIVSLKAAGSEGPYILKDFTLIRMPSAPTFMTEYGKVPEEGIAINGFSFSEYRDEPYEDAEAKERLEFLSKLGGGA